MNSDTREIIEGFIREAEAVMSCGSCGSYDVWADDADAEQQVYAMATNAWKKGVFRGDSREAIMEVVKSALDDVNIDCPGCSRNSSGD